MPLSPLSHNSLWSRGHGLWLCSRVPSPRVFPSAYFCGDIFGVYLGRSSIQGGHKRNLRHLQPLCTVKAFFAAVYALRHSTAAFMLRVLLYENIGGVTVLFVLLARPALTGSIPTRGPVELRYGCRRPNTVYAVYAISSLDTEGSLEHGTQTMRPGARQDGARRPWAVQGS